jgi:proteasome accessory factor A
VEVQRALADLAGEFVSSGAAAELVPGAEAIVGCWRETLEMLVKRDLGALARRCDWALKLLLLDRQRTRRNLSWQAPEIRALDLLFSSLDPQEGLFWQMAAAGLVENMPAPETVERFHHEPPEDTRAYLRAHVLRRFGNHVVHMDWDRVRFRLQTDRYWWSETVLDMSEPTRFTKADSEAALERCGTLSELIEAVGADPWQGRPKNGISIHAEAWGQRSDGHEVRPPKQYGRPTTWY